MFKFEGFVLSGRIWITLDTYNLIPAAELTALDKAGIYLLDADGVRFAESIYRCRNFWYNQSFDKEFQIMSAIKFLRNLIPALSFVEAKACIDYVRFKNEGAKPAREISEQELEVSSPWPFIPDSDVLEPDTYTSGVSYDQEGNKYIDGKMAE